VGELNINAGLQDRVVKVYEGLVYMNLFNFRELQPQFILEVEVGELNINAGLQDRVVQVYEGLVYMDFSR
jgi:galactokinase/mevalonate kinase-like predicted kinase